MGQSAIVGKTALYTRIAHSTHGEEAEYLCSEPMDGATRIQCTSSQRFPCIIIFYRYMLPSM